ncbi:enoyl-CoA hydratase/isomerase family protein [Tistrella bauzanensis]
MTVPLTRILTAARVDDRVRCIVFGGTGGVFSAGGDVAGFRRALAEPVAERQAGFRARLDDAAAMVEALLQVDRPVVAALRGPVAGAGLAFVLAADLVVADETAMLIFAHRTIGLTLMAV